MTVRKHQKCSHQAIVRSKRKGYGKGKEMQRNEKLEKKIRFGRKNDSLFDLVFY